MGVGGRRHGKRYGVREGGGKRSWMGGALGSAATGRDAVNGTGEASHGGGPKITS